jgi:hypothetical protein
VKRTVLAVGLVALSLSLAVPGLAHASGPKKLKQPSSFPLVISQPGSYVLVSNITVPDANTTAISITADNVTLDLGGFSILGPTACSGGPPVTSCSPTGTGNGIDGSSGNHANITILNGTVQGMGNVAVFVGPRARIEKVRAVSDGVSAFPSAAIWAGSGSMMAANTVINNGGSGLSAAGFASISGNVVTGNNGDGIDCTGPSCIVTNNTSSYNNGSGIAAGDSAIVTNTLIANAAAGLNAAGGTVGYTNDVFRANAFGSVGGSGTDMGNNDCNGSTTCP